MHLDIFHGLNGQEISQDMTVGEIEIAVLEHYAYTLARHEEEANRSRQIKPFLLKQTVHSTYCCIQNFD